MAKINNLTLEVQYTSEAASYSYATLTLSDNLPDASQLQVFFNVQLVVETSSGLEVPVSNFSASDQAAIRVLPETAYTVDDTASQIKDLVIPAGNPTPVSGYDYAVDQGIDPSSYLAVQRSTDVSAAVIDFQPGSRLTSTQLEAQKEQEINAIQELTQAIAVMDAGTTGPIGPEGPAGPAGPEGPEGPEGPNGSIDILTDVDTTTAPPTPGQTLEWDGANWVPSAGGAGDMTAAVYDPAAKTEQVLTITDKDEIVQSSVSTGVVDGGILSVNGGDNTKFDISAGFGYVIDTTTTPNSPSFTKVSWTTKSALTLTYLATNLITFVSINSAGTVIQQTTPWTAAQRRDDIILGVVVHVNLTIADTVNNQQAPASNVGAQLHDLYEAIGFLNVNGNVFGPSGADLTVDKTEGHMLAHGSNWDTDTQNPHERTLVSLTDATFQYRFQDGTNGVTGTVIDPNIYDNAGVSTAVPTNKWTVQRFFSFTSNNVKVQPGQTIYNSKSAAIAALTTEPFTVEPSINANGLFRTWLVVKEGATDLSDENEAVFFQAGKFGASTASAGGSLVSELNDLSDVDTLTIPPSTGEVLEWDGANWIPGTGGGAASVSLEYANWSNTGTQIDVAWPNSLSMLDNAFSITTGGDTSILNGADLVTDKDWTAPADGRYRMYIRCSFGIATGGTGTARGTLGILKNGAGQGTSYDYGDVEAANLHFLSVEDTFDLLAGDTLDPVFGVGTGSADLSLRYFEVYIHRLDFDTTLSSGITLATLQAETAAATDFADFQARIAAL